MRSLEPDPIPVLQLPAIGSIQKHEGRVLVAEAASGAGKLAKRSKIITIGVDGRVARWSYPSLEGDLLRQLDSAAESAALHNESGRVAVAHPRGVTVYEPPQLSSATTLTALDTRVSSMAFAPDGRSLLIGGVDGMVYRWRFDDAKVAKTPQERERLIERYIGHGSVVSAVLYHPLGRLLFSGDWTGALNVWLRFDADPLQGRYDRTVLNSRFFSEGAQLMRAGTSSGDNVVKIIVTPDGEFVATAQQSGTFQLWKVRGLKEVAKTALHPSLIFDIAFSPDGRSLVSVGRDATLRFATIQRTESFSGQDQYSVVTTRTVDALGARRVVFLNDAEVAGFRESGEIVYFDAQTTVHSTEPLVTQGSVHGERINE